MRLDKLTLVALAIAAASSQMAAANQQAKAKGFIEGSSLNPCFIFAEARSIWAVAVTNGYFLSSP